VDTPLSGSDRYSEASSPEHIRENRDAHDIKLTERDVQELDHASRRRDARRRSTWANYLFAVSDREVYH
jgi:diketogulonate reductase-like aldo/keto reductase